MSNKSIKVLVDEYAKKKKYYDLSCSSTTVHNLISGDAKYAFTKQKEYDNSEYLAANIKCSVKSYTRDKGVAISIYQNFCEFLRRNDIEVNVEFPPINVSNNFERLMFISKHLQNPDKKVSDLEDELWVSERTIEDDLKKLRGLDDNPIQICGKVFKIDDIERRKDKVTFSSTAHPLFLTPNLTQVLVTLKGLKTMSENPLYKEYAQSFSTDIWEQLSDYAKDRIRYVLSELIPEDLSWYENLAKDEEEHFYSEYRCSPKGNVFLDCIKNGKSFYVEYSCDEGTQIYKNCTFVPQSYDGESIEVESDSSRIRLYLDKILKSSYTAEELM